MELKNNTITAMLATLKQGWQHRVSEKDMTKVYDAGYNHGFDYGEEKIDMGLYDTYMSILWHRKSYELIFSFKKVFRKRTGFKDINISYDGPDMSYDEAWRAGFDARMSEIIKTKDVTKILLTFYAIAWCHGFDSSAIIIKRKKETEELFKPMDISDETRNHVKSILKDIGWFTK